MIISDRAEVRIDGDLPSVLSDLSAAIKAVYAAQVDHGLTEKEAKENIAFAGKLAFMTDKELKVSADERKKIIEKFKKAYEQE